MLIDRFFVFLPDPAAQGSPSHARVERFLKTEGLFLEANQWKLGCSPQPSRPAEGQVCRILTYSGTLHSPLVTEAAALSHQSSAVHEWATKHLRSFVFMEGSSEVFRIAPDLLGLRRFYWSGVEGGVAAASSIFDLLTCFPELLHPVDSLSLSQLLASGSPVGGGTLHQRIRVSTSGMQLRWTPESGTRKEEQERFRPPPPDSSLRPGDAVKRIWSALQESIQDCVSPWGRAVVPLTGGYDSRLLACAAASSSLPVEAATLGRSYHLEVRVAKAAARILGIPHQTIPPRKRFLDLLDRWLEVTEGQVSSGTAFLDGFTASTHPPGACVLSGFLGDVLAGGMSHWMLPDSVSGVEGLARFITQRKFRGLGKDYFDRLGLESSEQAFEQCVREHLMDGIESHQALVLWNLEQVPGFAAQVGYLGSKYAPALPFYRPELMRRWLEVPPVLVHDKHLLRLILENSQPSLATLPHSDRSPAHFPRSWPEAGYLIPWAWQRMVHSWQRRLLPPGKQRANRTDIWHAWSGLSGAERSRAARTIEENRDSVTRVLGWTPPETSEPAPWKAASQSPEKELRVLKGMLMVGVYCRFVEERILGKHKQRGRVLAG